MPIVTYICPDGEVEAIEVPAGTSIMKAAVANGIESIVGDCGGSAACATCHVYVESPLEELSAKSDDEVEMLADAASEVLPNSRLGCRVIMSDELSPLVVRVAPEQW
ncbi:2Fe-2S iron-sulfur cluster-binding protein [Rhodococcus sp. NPDC127530]|uniref:2Fe-2S iron-sulfur cluster-binding protein n=1 Tax=unclassified Rhodococcus (in: high G+C Gram-positive bacteria) TaxID=192944 RepID=UPI003640D6B0